MPLTPQQKEVLANMSSEKREKIESRLTTNNKLEKIEENIAKELAHGDNRLEFLEKKVGRNTKEIGNNTKRIDETNKKINEHTKKTDKIQKDLDKIWWDYYYSWVYPLIFNLAIGAYIFRTPIKNNIHDILADLGITKERNKSFFEFWGIPLL